MIVINLLDVVKRLENDISRMSILIESLTMISRVLINDDYYMTCDMITIKCVSITKPWLDGIEVYKEL